MYKLLLLIFLFCPLLVYSNEEGYGIYLTITCEKVVTLEVYGAGVGYSFEVRKLWMDKDLEGKWFAEVDVKKDDPRVEFYNSIAEKIIKNKIETKFVEVVCGEYNI